MDNNEKKTVTGRKEPSELEKFIAEHQETFDRWKRIEEGVAEDMAEIARHKAEHPEMYDTEYQVEVTNRFIEENPDVPHVFIAPKGDDE